MLPIWYLHPSRPIPLIEMDCSGSAVTQALRGILATLGAAVFYNRASVCFSCASFVMRHGSEISIFSKLGGRKVLNAGAVMASLLMFFLLMKKLAVLQPKIIYFLYLSLRYSSSGALRFVKCLQF